MAQQDLVPVDTLKFREIFASTDAGLVKFLAEREAVHPITAKDLLESRLAPKPDYGENNCYNKHAYIVESEDCPEAVIYVRLMKRKMKDGIVQNEDLPGNIKLILSEKEERLEEKWNPPNTAILYSVTNLTGNSFAKGEKARTAPQKLKHDVIDHTAKIYGLNTFTTLSPMRLGMSYNATGFAQWLPSGLNSTQPLLTKLEEETLRVIADRLDQKPNNTYELIKHLHNNYGQMNGGEKIFFENLMRGLGADYIINVKSEKSENKIRDIVGHIHSGNGAMFANIHYTPAAQMISQSENIGALGLMVNYRYEPEHLESRSERYSSGIVTIGHNMKNLHDYRQNQFGTPVTNMDKFMAVKEASPVKPAVLIV